MHYNNSMTIHGVLPQQSWHQALGTVGAPPATCSPGCIPDPNLAQKEQEWQKARQNALQRAIQELNQIKQRGGFIRSISPEGLKHHATRLANQANNILRYNRIPLTRPRGGFAGDKPARTIGVDPITAAEVMSGAAAPIQQAPAPVEAQQAVQQAAQQAAVQQAVPQPVVRQAPAPRRARSRRGSYLRTGGPTVFGVNPFYGQYLG